MKQKLYILAMTAICMATGAQARTEEVLKFRPAHEPSVKLAESHMVKDESKVRLHKLYSSIRRMPRLDGKPFRANTSGSEIFAYRLMPDEVPSLIDFTYDGTENVRWEGSEYWVPTTGFLYDGKLYGISSTYLYGTFYIDRMDMDVTTGEFYYTESVSQSPTMAAIAAAYDPTSGYAYTYSYTENLDGYMFSRFKPEDFIFQFLSDTVKQEDVCLAMTYDERREAMMGITSDGRFVRLDLNTGVGETLARLPISPAFSNTAIAYSPIDNVYVAEVIHDNRECSIIKIDADDYDMEVTHSWDEKNIRQYTVMFTLDDMFTPGSPAAPTIGELSVADPELNGSLTITMPARTSAGTDLTGMLDLVVRLDGTEYLRKNNLQPGAAVEIPLSGLTEGMHVVTARAVKGDEDGASLVVRHYFGYDTPMPPANVRLEGSLACWDAVTEGVNGGYIDQLSYEVWLNDEMVGQTHDCSMQLDLPEDISYNTVVVYAVSAGHKSEAGISAIQPYGFLPLGTVLHPDSRDWPAFTVVDGNNDGFTWEQSDWYGVSYDQYTADSETADETLITPAYKVTENATRHILSFNAGLDGVWESAELELYMGTSPSLDAMSRIGNVNLTANGDHYEIYLLPEQGPLYAAFRISSPAYVWISDISIDCTGVSVSAPDDVTELSVEAAPLGAERATVSFTMPLTTVGGTPLTSDVEATVGSDRSDDTVTVTGRPGAKVETSVKVPEGIARVYVQTKGGSKVYSSSLYIGADTALAPEEYDYEVSEDNMEVTLNWAAPSEGEHGAWYDPESVYYEVSIFSDEEGWILLDNNLEATTFTYRLPAGSPQRAWYFSVTPCNSVGPSESSLSIPVAMGTPYALPMEDYMLMGGTIGPLMTEGGDEYGAGWTISYPEWFEEEADEITDYVLIGTNDGEATKGLLILPKFNPASGERVMGYFRFFFGENTPDINFYVNTYSENKKLVKQVRSSEMPKGYQTVVVLLPEGLASQPWAQIAIEAVYDGSSQCLIFPSYSNFGAYSKDCAVTGLTGNPKITLAEPNKYVVSVRNDGFESTSVPEISLELRNGGKIVAEGTLSNEVSLSTLYPGDDVDMHFDLNVDLPEYIGACELVASIKSGDKNDLNDEFKRSVTLSSGTHPVVTDLVASLSEAGETLLTWSQPDVECLFEGFENCNPFVIESNLGEFENIDADGADTMGYCFPYHTPQGSPTGWVIWDRSEIENAPYNNNYVPCTGDRMAVAIANYEGPADDWLISPAVAGGTELSFAIAAGMNGQNESLYVMASSTGTDISDFNIFEKIDYMWEQWDNVCVTLPADARYFALRYVGTGCCLFIDDISFTPALANAEFIGYDVFRNGELLAENVASDCRYTDSTARGEDDIYRVSPVYRLDGKTLRGLQSNLAGLSISGVEVIPGFGAEISGGIGEVVIRNAEGQIVRLIDIDGRILSEIDMASDEVHMPCEAGIVFVGIGNRFQKVLVK